ncbi:MAG: sulfite exporter TauE/SafE family protein [Bacillota bacterium]
MIIKNVELFIKGMTCSNCERIIEKALLKLDGVKEARVSYENAKANISFDADIINLEKIKTEIAYKGYEASEKNAGTDTFKINQLVGLGVIVLALYVIIDNTIGFNFIPEVNQSMSLGLLFIVGLLTSLHCIAMCGGINLSQCVAYKHYEGSKIGKLKPSLLYNTGRVISYTIIGGIVGGIGSIISFSGSAKGIVAIVSGIFMIIMGINMLDLLPWLKKLNPRIPSFFRNRLAGKGKHSPLYIGLLNGLMPCGPLQSMQLYALGTGSVLLGALSMLLFSLGTVPLMFGFGAITSMLGSRFTKNIMKIGSVMVIILGLIMMGRGLSLSGVNTLPAQAGAVEGAVAVMKENVQVVEIDLLPGSYEPIVVQKGVPVKFIINADEANINGCNDAILIPKYNLQKGLNPGQNIIEFTPEEAGVIPYTCWMGMISSTITIVDDLNNIDAEKINEGQVNTVPASGGCGGCCN